MASPQRGVLADQPGSPGPGRQRVDRLDERRAHHGPERVAGTAGPPGFVKIRDQLLDLGQVQQRGYLCAVARKCYGRSGHGVHPLVQPPGGSSLAGGTFYFLIFFDNSVGV